MGWRRRCREFDEAMRKRPSKVTRSRPQPTLFTFTDPPKHERMTFRLWSNDFEDGGKMKLAQALDGWGHEGSNISPHLAWENAPPGTQSFVLMMFDPSPAAVSGWWHWVLIDLPGTVSELPRGAGKNNASLPVGANHGRNDFSHFRYDGPAPDKGMTNSYVFTLFAMRETRLEVEGDATAAMISWTASASALGKATITGLYI